MFFLFHKEGILKRKRTTEKCFLCFCQKNTKKLDIIKFENIKYRKKGLRRRVFQEFCVTLQFNYTDNYAKTFILHHRVGLQRGSGSAALSPRSIRSDG